MSHYKNPFYMLNYVFHYVVKLEYYFKTSKKFMVGG